MKRFLTYTLKIVFALLFLAICINNSVNSEDKKLPQDGVAVTHWMPAETYQVAYANLKKIGEHKDLEPIQAKFGAKISSGAGLSVNNAHTFLKVKSHGDVGQITIIQGGKSINAEDCIMQQLKEVKHGAFIYYQLKDDAGFAHFPSAGTIVIAEKEKTLQKLLDNSGKSKIPVVLKQCMVQAELFDIYEITIGNRDKKPFNTTDPVQLPLVSLTKGAIIDKTFCNIFLLSAFTSEQDAVKAAKERENEMEKSKKRLASMAQAQVISDSELKLYTKAFETAKISRSGKSIKVILDMPLHTLIGF